MSNATTVHCYDRYAAHKRFGAMALASLLLGAGALLAAGQAEAAPVKVERLPSVVVTGKAVKAVKLPTVVVEGRRAPDAAMLAAAEDKAAQFRRVTFVVPAIQQ